MLARTGPRVEATQATHAMQAPHEKPATTRHAASRTRGPTPRPRPARRCVPTTNRASPTWTARPSSARAVSASHPAARPVPASATTARPAAPTPTVAPRPAYPASAQSRRALHRVARAALAAATATAAYRTSACRAPATIESPLVRGSFNPSCALRVSRPSRASSPPARENAAACLAIDARLVDEEIAGCVVVEASGDAGHIIGVARGCTLAPWPHVTRDWEGNEWNARATCVRRSPRARPIPGRAPRRAR